MGLKFPRRRPKRLAAKSWTPRISEAVFFERQRCCTRRIDDHRQEHTGSDPGPQCLRSWLDQDSRGCRSERLDRFRIRPQESSFRPQLAFVATGDGPRRHAPRALTTPEAIAVRLMSWILDACVRSRTEDAIRSRSSSRLGRKSQPPPAQAGEALGFWYQSPLCREAFLGASASGPFRLYSNE
jgi:hypothetical protein